MYVFIANFGRGNHLWPTCLATDSIITFQDDDLHPLWTKGDRERYIEHCLETKTTAAGITPTRAVAARWFNLGTTVSATAGDLWIHREREELWWATSLPDAVQITNEASQDPNPRTKRVYLLRKSCTSWQKTSKRGAPLLWAALHPKAREFLFTEGTLQQLAEDNAAYACALIAGDDLEPWHVQKKWRAKLDQAGRNPATIFSSRQITIARMVMTVMSTVAGANGQQALRTLKNKELRMSKFELEQYIDRLIESQKGMCAITGLALQYDKDATDPELICSLDRIDSDGHYEGGNLQVVCRFVNRWKSNDDDAEFRRLVSLVQRHASVMI